MVQVLYLLVGGATGTLCRYLLSVWVQRFMNHPFPYGILSVNVIGSFFIGFCWSLAEEFTLPQHIRLFLFTGFFGGFTTFSTFALDTMNLMKSGEYKLAVFNIIVSNIAGLIAVFIGYFFGKNTLTLMK